MAASKRKQVVPGCESYELVLPTYAVITSGKNIPLRSCLVSTMDEPRGWEPFCEVAW
jgi:hypothetical protein